MNLPPGHFYRVYPESNEAASVVISVGQPSDIAETIKTELENQKGELTERAEEIQNRIANNTITGRHADILVLAAGVLLTVLTVTSAVFAPGVASAVIILLWMVWVVWAFAWGASGGIPPHF